MVFEFRAYGFYRGDRAVGDFCTGYIVANSIDEAIDLLYLRICYDDCESGILVRKVVHPMPDNKFLVVTGHFNNFADKGTGKSGRPCKNPLWVYVDPREWTKEGFSFGTPKIRIG